MVRRLGSKGTPNTCSYESGMRRGYEQRSLLVHVRLFMLQHFYISTGAMGCICTCMPPNIKFAPASSSNLKSYLPSLAADALKQLLAAFGQATIEPTVSFNKNWLEYLLLAGAQKDDTGRFANQALRPGAATRMSN